MLSSTRRIAFCLLLSLGILGENASAQPIFPFTQWGGGTAPGTFPPVNPNKTLFRLGFPNKLVYQRLDHVKTGNFRGDVETRVYELASTGKLMFAFQVTNRSPKSVVLDFVQFELPKFGTGAMDVGYVGNSTGKAGPAWATRSGDGKHFVFSFDPMTSPITPGLATKFTYFVVTSPSPGPGGRMDLSFLEPGISYAASLKFPQPR